MTNLVITDIRTLGTKKSNITNFLYFIDKCIH